MAVLADAPGLVREHGAIGALFVASAMAVWWLLTERKRLRSERDGARAELRKYIWEHTSREYARNIALEEKLQRMRDLGDRASKWKGAPHESA